MKAKNFLTVLFCCALLTGYAQQQIKVQTDKQLNHDFGQYQSFYWATQVEQQRDEGVYFLNDIALKGLVRESVQHEMEGRGYRLQRSSPDLIVNFRVFDQPTSIKGHTGYGTTFWGAEEVRTVEDTTSYNIEAGTLLVNIVDRREGHIVWTGFASGLIDHEAFLKDEQKIKEAVNLIFAEYEGRATDATRRDR